MAVKVTEIDTPEQARSFGKSGGNFETRRIKDKEELRVRFLGDPGETVNGYKAWVGYQEHYDAAKKAFFPCADDGTCEGCADGNRKSRRYLVSVIDMSAKEVIALVLPASLGEELLQKYDKFHTLKDRVYEIGRSGSGINDTTYSVDYGEVKVVDMSRFQALDLVAILNRQLPDSSAVADGYDDDLDGYADPDDDLEDLPVATKPAQRRPADDLDDEGFAKPATRPAAPATQLRANPQAAKALPRKVATPGAGGATPPRKLLKRPGQ